MEASLELAIPETGRRRTTSKLPFVAPILKDVVFLSDEELQEKWHQMFFDTYNRADDARRNGDHNEAIIQYREGQALINEIKTRGIQDPLILVREALLHYAIIQSYSNFQTEPDMVMREFHNFGEVLFDFVMLILKDDEEDTQQDTLMQIQERYVIDHYVNVNYLFDTVKKYFHRNKHKLSPEKLELVWKCSYFLTRFTGSIHDFFLRSTDLTEEGKKYHANCKEAASIAVEAMNLLPEGFVPNDPVDISDENKDPEKFQKAARCTLKNQTETWLDVYSDFLEIEIGHILGNDKPDRKKSESDKEDQIGRKRIEKLKNRAEEVMDKFQRGETHKLNVEFALEIKALTTFDDLLKNRISYQEAKKELEFVLLHAENLEFKRVQTFVQIFIARAAIRFEEIDDANSACDRIRFLRGKKQVYSVDSIHTFDKWLNVIQAEIQLLESGARAEIDEQRDETNGKVAEVTNFDSQRLIKSLTLDDISRIEEIFDAYRLDTESNRPKLSNKAMDAKIYYILGKTALAKVKLIGREYERLKAAKDDQQYMLGKSLLKAFMDCQKYLCEAYNNLQDVGFQGTRLFVLIQQKYKEMMDYNDELFNDFKKTKNNQVKSMPPEQEEAYMHEIAQDYRIQKWTDMVNRILRNQDLARAEDYEAVLNNAVGDALRQIVPTIGRTFMYDEGKNPRIVGDIPVEHISYVEESVYNFKNGRSKTYLYYTEDGKILHVMQLDKEKGRYMIVEVDLKLSPASEVLIEEVFEGVRHLLNLKSYMSELVQMDRSTEEFKTRSAEALEEIKDLAEYLFRRHEATLDHQNKMGLFCRTTAMYLNDKKDLNVDTVISYYAGLLHDIGKLSLNPKIQLDIPRRYQDFEKNETEKHCIEGLELLRGIPHFVEVFPEVFVLVGSHHVKYGLEPGYPVFAPGKEIRNLPKLLLAKLQDPTPAEIEALSFELSDDYVWMAWMMNLDDQAEALRNRNRKYRSPMPLAQFNGYLNRQAGVDFHPEAVRMGIDMFRRGLIGSDIAYTEEELQQLRAFKPPLRVYTAEELLEFSRENQNLLETKLGVSIDVLIKTFEKGSKYKLELTEELLRRSICDLYIKQVGGNVDEGKKVSKENEAEFLKDLWIYLGSKDEMAA